MRERAHVRTEISVYGFRPTANLAGFKSFMIKIRKFILRAPVPVCPWPSWPSGGFQIFYDQDTKTHTPRACAGLSVALLALSRAIRSWPTCAPSVRSRARPTGSHGTMQHGCLVPSPSPTLFRW